MEWKGARQADVEWAAFLVLCGLQPMEIFVDDEAKLTLHGLVQHYIMLNEDEKNRKLNDLLDALDFNQVRCGSVLLGGWRQGPLPPWIDVHQLL